MLSMRHRFPSRGSVAARPPSRRQMGAMLPAPPEGVGSGEFAGNQGPPQNLVGVALRELWVSILDAGTAIRLGDTSGKPRYFGTVTAAPQVLRSPSEANSPDSVNAGVLSSGNAPQMANKTASGAPRIARNLPLRPM